MENSLAKELNSILSDCVVERLLSDLGRRIYFPKGIIAQSEEAKKNGKTANATIGMTVVNGEPAILPCIQDCVKNFSSGEIVAYAPTAGNAELRAFWKNTLIQKNPSLKNKNFSLPIVTPGLTAGVSYVADLFVDENSSLLTANPSWDNYKLIVEARRNSKLLQFNMFKDGKFDFDSFKEALKDQAKTGAIRLLLNFPQNPSGYSPKKSEAKKIVSEIKSFADSGIAVLVICDDAYFGLAYEDDVYEESLFSDFADLSENILAIKLDGPTKEDFVWGFRCGFLTFACKNMKTEEYSALSTKITGLIRSSVSCSSTLPQSIILRTSTNEKIESQKLALQEILKARYKKVRKFVDSHKSDFLSPLPFNSGYFMSFSTNKIDAEILRKKLLSERGIGTVAIDSKTLRVAFSSLDEQKIESVYQAIYDLAENLSKN